MPKLIDTVKDIIGTVAPTIATALGGPLAGMATKVIASKVLGKPDATPEEVQEAVANASPADLLKFKEAELEFKQHLTDAGVNLAKIAADDRASARAMESATRSRVPAILAAVIVLGYFGILAAILAGWFKLDSQNQALLILLGALATSLGQVVNFFFGSSSDSHRKTELLGGKSP